MSETSEVTYLDGGVTVRNLPRFHGAPPGPTAPVMKRLILPQGELAQFWDSTQGMHYIAAIEVVPGAVRGNHYHNQKEEVVYVLTGKIVLVVADPANSARAEIALEPGSLVRIRTGIAHALKGLEAGFAIESSTTRFDPADVVRHPVA